MGNKKQRIIIDCVGVDIDTALVCVKYVISEGKVSVAQGVKHYCWLTTWKNGIAVSTRRKKKGQKSDSFICYNQKDLVKVLVELTPLAVIKG